MKRLFASALSAGAICAVLSVTPSAAQVTGNARVTHTPTPQPPALQSPRMEEYTASVTDPDNAGCSVVHDFNTSQSHYQYMAVCPFGPFR
jgi:hypothetical protein